MAKRAMRLRSHLEGPLFEAIHRDRVFTDAKRFADAVPLDHPATIVRRFQQARARSEFDLRSFVTTHFDEPPILEVPPSAGDDLEAYVDAQWTTLRQQHDPRNEFDTLLPLPNPHVVPGGRFREMYYWDSYFAAEGLATAGLDGWIREMVENLAHLVETYGYVPNGNQQYYLGRSQPPVFALMVELLAAREGTSSIEPFLPALRAEHRYWTDGGGPEAAFDGLGARVVAIDGVPLARYWDDTPGPRVEAYPEDRLLAREVPRSRRRRLYRDVRAACESGWDFSSRWLRDPDDFASIRTTELLPVDLNALVCYMEFRLADWLADAEPAVSQAYASAASRRREALLERCWCPDRGYFFDYDWHAGSISNRWTLAGVVPLFLGLVTEPQADRVATTLETRFLQPGGLLTTGERSGQQWDAPNGWAPMHWFAVCGLRRYGHGDLADTVERRWLETVTAQFERTGELFEKYDVVEPTRLATGGEYPAQRGFGWTNGVIAALNDGPATEGPGRGVGPDATAASMDPR